MPSRVLEKVERRLGQKLFLKGDRCLGPKCAAMRRAYPPGAHGKTRRRRRESSEFGALLREKQKMRFLYGLDDSDIKKYIKNAEGLKGTFSANVLRLVEQRLDNIVFRLGLAQSRRKARQAVTHGHIAVNGKGVFTPSYQVKKGEVVGVKERSLKSGLFRDADDRLRSYTPPVWLELDKSKKTGLMIGEPAADEVTTLIDITKIKEFYSR